MLLESAVVRVKYIGFHDLVIHANRGVVDVDHVTYFVATAKMVVTKDGEVTGKRVAKEGLGVIRDIGRKERRFVVAIKRKDELIRITLNQKQMSYSRRLMLMEVET